MEHDEHRRGPTVRDPAPASRALDEREHGAPAPEPFEQRHADGSLWARGHLLEGERHGRWEWFRVDGTRMRSGAYDRGTQVGEWTTYDADGGVHGVRRFPGPPGSATDHTSDDTTGWAPQ